jgi:hypothetical protein
MNPSLATGWAIAGVGQKVTGEWKRRGNEGWYREDAGRALGQASQRKNAWQKGGYG